MGNELNNTDIVKKVGGRFRLTSLIQKRLVELIQGSRPLIENAEGKMPMEIVIEEIKQNKIAVADEHSDTSAPQEERKGL